MENEQNQNEVLSNYKSENQPDILTTLDDNEVQQASVLKLKESQAELIKYQPPDEARKKDDEDPEDISEEDLEKKIKEMSGQQKIEYFIKRFDTQIKWMDFSFEKVFQKKDKEFMIAYREHIQTIQNEIDSMKASTNDSNYMKLKNEKIESLENKLQQIRKQALFIGNMSEMHKKAIK